MGLFRRSVVTDFAGAWDDLPVGVNPVSGESNDAAVPSMEWADASLDMPGIPEDGPVNTRLEGPYGLPWWDAKEDPAAPTGLDMGPDPVSDPWRQSIGWRPLPGAYEPAVRTHGSVIPAYNGYEVSGGLTGDQAYGRIMRFPANVPERFDPDGVYLGDYADELAASVHHGSEPIVTDNEVITSLIMGV